MPYAKQRAISEFFVAVARQRGFPLHVCNLWNALYFTYDLKRHGYGGAIDLDRIPQRVMHSKDAALPVGAFMRVVTKTQAGELWSEVVYKEGRYRDVSADWVPPEISGAAASVEPTAEEAVVREALVLDYAAFGDDWNDCTPAQYARIMRKGHWLDEYGHLVVDAIYAARDAELDDASFYARYLFQHHRDGLLAFALTEDATDDDVWAALLQSLQTVAEIASQSSGLKRWRDYYFDADVFGQRLREEGDEALLGRWQLRELFNELIGAQRTRYTAVGLAIRDLLGRDLNRADASIMTAGVNYSTAVCEANAYILDRLRSEAPNGRLSPGHHLRLDDGWQYGGIWRSEPITTCAPSLLLVPPEIPLGLGYAAAQPASAPVREDPQVVTRSQQGWRVTLGAGMLDRGELPVSPSAAELIRNHKLLVRVRHDGKPATGQTVVYDPEARLLTGVEWPLGLYAGIYVLAQVEQKGQVVVARTERLAHPLIAGDEELWFDGDPDVFLRWQAIDAGHPIAALRQPSQSLRDLIAIAFRTRGRELPDGGRQLSTEEVVACVLGFRAAAVEASAVVNALGGMDLERSGDLWSWWPVISQQTRTSDRQLLATYLKRSRRARSVVRRHLVPMHLRWLEGWKQASWDKTEGYQQARRKYRMHGVLPADLPDGYTWVEEHTRNYWE